MIWLLIIRSLKLLILVLCSGSCLAQQLQWTCSPSSDSEITYFPNIPIDETSLVNSVRDSPYLSNAYVYRFRPFINESCKRKTSVEFCFEDTESVSDIEMAIILARIDDARSDNTTFTGIVLDSISINATVECNQELRNNHHVCCHSERIDTSLPIQMNGISVLFPNQRLLEYNDSQYQVETFVTDVQEADILKVDSNGQPIIQGNGYFMNLNLRFLRFTIDDNESPETTKPPRPSGPPNAIYIAVLVPIISVLATVLLIVAVIILAFKWQKEKRKKINQRTESEGLINVNYDGGRVLSNRVRTIERSVIHDYAVASIELDSSEHVITRAATYEKPLMSTSLQNNETSDEEIYVDPASDECALCSQLKMYICNRDTISLIAELGSGQFGTVYKGEWVAPEGGEKIEVAVKQLQPGASEEDKVKFLQEAAINGQFRHPNVVKLMGVVTEGEPIMLILELLPEGDLRKVLNSIDRHSIDADLPHTLLSYCRQVAAGMSYLSIKLFVHRDLAARNILLSVDGACKIADFGMSRDLADADYYVSHGGKIPVKWTAPEAIHYKKYSTASDVWSFGCVMYEIWSLGHKPFESNTNVECIKIVDKGTRLAPPPGCPRIVYKLMMDCWHPEPSSRPDFPSVVQQLSLPDTKVLKWSEEDRGTDPEAATLGVGNDKALNLYKDLQKQYV